MRTEPVPPAAVPGSKSTAAVVAALEKRLQGADQLGPACSKSPFMRRFCVAGAVGDPTGPSAATFRDRDIPVPARISEIASNDDILRIYVSYCL
jgi:hypothetical protein